LNINIADLNLNLDTLAFAALLSLKVRLNNLSAEEILKYS